MISCWRWSRLDWPLTLTFDLDPNINRGHLLIKDYLPTKFEASSAKRSWVISCTRWSRLACPMTLTFIYWPEYQQGSSTHEGLSIYYVWSFLGKTFLSYQSHKVKGYRHTDRHVQSNIPLLFQREKGRGINIDVCITLMPPFPNIWRIGLTFGPDLWPTDLNINRDHLLNKDHLPTKFEASGANAFLSYPSHKVLETCMNFDLDLLTWIWIGVIYSSRTIYLPSLKLVGQSVLELSVAQGEVDWHDLWPWPLTYWPEYQQGSSTHEGLSIYYVWSFLGKAFLSYQLHKVKGYRHTDRHVQSNIPSFFKGKKEGAKI